MKMWSVMKLLKFILIFFSLQSELMCDARCSIKINGDLPSPQPLLLHSDESSGFIYPKLDTDEIILSTGHSIRLACPGNSLTPIDSYNDTVLVTCHRDKEFFIGEDKKIQETFREINCTHNPKSFDRKTADVCNHGKNTVGEIGYSIYGKNGEIFVKIIDFCHDDEMQQTIYAHAKVQSTIDAHQHDVRRPTFAKGFFYNKTNVDKLYNRTNQINTLDKILNNSTLARKYIHPKGNYYFARGHLIAKSDFVYASEQRATFYYANVVPMWQVINNGNWKFLEEATQKYASSKDTTLDVWTGVFGILRLNDTNGTPNEIFLDHQNKKIPVPKLLFKVLYDANKKAGVVFITINNPHLNYVTNEYKICPDVCNRVRVFNFNRFKHKLGFTYCCSVDSFRKVVDYLPQFKTLHLLQ